MLVLMTTGIDLCLRFVTNRGSISSEGVACLPAAEYSALAVK